MVKMDSVQRGQKRVTGGMRRGSQVDWEIVFPYASDDALDLLRGLLNYDPQVPTLLTPQPSTENVAPGERLGVLHLCDSMAGA